MLAVNLLGVDSAGSGGGDVMELIGRIGATRATRELLLDSVMQGFIHQLFVEKCACAAMAAPPAGQRVPPATAVRTLVSLCLRAPGPPNIG